MTDVVKKLEYTIYEIKCNDEDKEFSYIGSTNNYNRRKKEHKKSCINEKNNYLLYKFIRENGGWANFQMNIIEIIECETQTEARIREQYWLENKKANLNKFNAYSTKEIIKEQRKKYYEQNKEKINQYRNQYYEQNKEKEKKYYEQNKEQYKQYQKQYREKNKEQTKKYYEQKKIYCEKNKEKIRQYQKHYQKQYYAHIKEQKLINNESN